MQESEKQSMKCLIDGKSFRYVENAIKSSDDRASYFDLAKKVFRLDFAPWYESGFCGDNFIPYTLYDGEIAVASVGVAVSDFKWQNRIKRYAQISTVMTDPEYRGMRLSTWLMELALKEWEEKSDLVYLYANDSVLDYYTRFGFEKVEGYTYKFPIFRQSGQFRKLNLSNPGDTLLLTSKYASFNNPYSVVTMENNLSLLMFHCITFLRDNIYYVEQFDAVVIAEYERDTIFVYDIYTNATCGMGDILGVLAAENMKTAVLGFTPNIANNCVCEKSEEKNTTIFTLKAKDNIFLTHQITLPFLSRA